MRRICYIIGAYHGEDACIRPTAEDLIIAADGGYAALQSLGVTARLAVGDFDSLGYVPEGVEVVRHPVRKDDTDTMLAISLGLERGYRNFVILGSIGGRLDHTLANLQTLLYLLKHDARGLLYGDGTAVTAVRNGTIAIEGSGMFSVFAADPRVTGVCIENAGYPLSDGVLTSDYPLGVSNEFLEGSARIGAESGTLLVLWTADKSHLPQIIGQL